MMGSVMSLQVSHLEDIPSGADYNPVSTFVIRNNSGEQMQVSLKMADGNNVATILDDGWNPILCKAVYSAPAELQAGW